MPAPMKSPEQILAKPSSKHRWPQGPRAQARLIEAFERICAQGGEPQGPVAAAGPNAGGEILMDKRTS
eukprot:3922207-Alexandrium_andersonii.AAC.1